MELVSLTSEVPQPVNISWSAELYQGEFDDLTKCSLYSMEVSEPILPLVKEDDLGISISHTNQPTAEILQVCEFLFNTRKSSWTFNSFFAFYRFT